MEKVQSETDKREYHLRVTEKYYKYYKISQSYVDTVLKRVQERCSREDVDAFDRVLTIMKDELMPEVGFGKTE